MKVTDGRRDCEEGLEIRKVMFLVAKYIILNVQTAEVVPLTFPRSACNETTQYHDHMAPCGHGITGREKDDNLRALMITVVDTS